MSCANPLTIDLAEVRGISMLRTKVTAACPGEGASAQLGGHHRVIAYMRRLWESILGDQPPSSSNVKNIVIVHTFVPMVIKTQGSKELHIFPCRFIPNFQLVTMVTSWHMP